MLAAINTLSTFHYEKVHEKGANTLRFVEERFYIPYEFTSSTKALDIFNI